MKNIDKGFEQPINYQYDDLGRLYQDRCISLSFKKRLKYWRKICLFTNKELNKNQKDLTTKNLVLCWKEVKLDKNTLYHYI